MLKDNNFFLCICVFFFSWVCNQSCWEKSHLWWF